ncbi:MAG TPA: DUF2306 domain-containing protein [Flavisolibacter sp.]|nr:DUF2306 domain-containing protein [Flavisolibacter sp.]
MLLAQRRPSPARLLLLAAYGFFCWLMWLIVAQYFEGRSDTAFLGIKQEYVRLPFYLPAFYIHVFASVLALPAGLSQFSSTLQRRFPAIHRFNGWLYVASILLLAAPSGFYIGLFANGGLSSRISFCLLALLWFWFTLAAVRNAIQKRFSAHKAFMYRSFALTLSAITLRIWKYALVATLHPRPMDVYQVVAWLGWIPNLLIAEYLIFKRIRK